MCVISSIHIKLQIYLDTDVTIINLAVRMSYMVKTHTGSFKPIFFELWCFCLYKADELEPLDRE